MAPDDEHYIGYTFTDVARLLRTVFERRVREFGLTRAQWTVIARIYHRQGLSQSDVAGSNVALHAAWLLTRPSMTPSSPSQICMAD